ncbi:MAG: glycosyltransferase family 4 protein [Sphingomonadaceae bacterium]|nr:glycosyltransferase family 4 protein [Sphingomonadaceae bacterium]
MEWGTRETEILLPAGARIWRHGNDSSAELPFPIRGVGPRGLKGHLWEQIALPIFAGRGTLLNFCSSAPIARRKQAVMIHDAQVWDVPETFSRSFVAAYRVLLPIISRRSRHVLTVSQFAKERLEAHGVVPKDKAVVIYNGSDHMDRISPDSDVLARYGLTSGSYFFALGSVARHKNIKTVIEARQMIGEDIPPLIIAGGGNAKVFSGAGLSLDEKHGRFIGRVSDEELKALYTNALALVFPSITEGFGLPPVEAMRCGCPVIATTGGAVPEVCGDAALYADPRDASQWAAAMEQVTLSADLRSGLKSKGLVRAGQFEWSRAARELVDTLGLEAP